MRGCSRSYPNEELAIVAAYESWNLNIFVSSNLLTRTSVVHRVSPAVTYRASQLVAPGTCVCIALVALGLSHHCPLSPFRVSPMQPSHH
jgi:hypothetical protein